MLAALFVATTSSFGIIKAYSPILVADMWDGYAKFAIQLAEGHWQALWGWHNEHRLLLPRLFFIADIWLFGATSVCLLGAIMLVQLGSALTLWSFARPQPKESVWEKRWLAALIVIPVFSWTQHENFIWGFQIQFVLVFLLALLAFRLAASTDDAWRRTVAIGLIGATAAGTMANGLLLLPALAGFYLLACRDLRRTALFTAISLGIWALYFLAPPSGHASPSPALAWSTAPRECLAFTLVYLGGLPRLGLWARGIFGSLGLALLLYFIAHARARLTRQHWALLFFLLFIAATAALTAAGRISFGINQAQVSRYMTPALLFWAGLLVLGYSLAQSRRERLLVQGCALILALLGVLGQKGLLSTDKGKFDKEVAMLSLMFEANDDAAEVALFPRPPEMRETLKDARRELPALFASTAASRQIQLLGSKVAVAAGDCQASLATTVRLNEKWNRLTGKISSGTPDLPTIVLLDASNTVVGIGLKMPGRQDWRGYGLQYPQDIRLAAETPAKRYVLCHP